MSTIITFTGFRRKMTWLNDVFADTSFWIATIITSDRLHDRAGGWSTLVSGKIITTEAVILETANALSKPTWRMAAVRLVDRISERENFQVLPLTTDLWQKSWALYCERQDKAWSLTDCMSFVAMQSIGLRDALSSDKHFAQAGFRALLTEDPPAGSFGTN